MKITIDNTEVVCSNDFTINQEMLNTPSVILNNVYPKSWETDKDYTTNFYHPEDYTQCLIYDGEYIQTEIKGSTTQSGTPTPSSPVPIVNKTGTIQETIDGKQYTFNLGSIELCKIGNYEDRIFKSSGKNLFDINDTNVVSKSVVVSVSWNILTQRNTGTYCRSEWVLTNLTVGENYTFSAEYSNPNASTLAFRIYDSTNTTNVKSGGNFTTTSGTSSVTFKATETTHVLRIYTNSTGTSNTYTASFWNVQLEEGSTSTSFEPYGTYWYVEKNIYDYDTWDTVNRTTVNTTTTAYQFLFFPFSFPQ